MSTTPPFGFGSLSPGIAEITLPPGMTLAQYESLQGSLVTTAIAVAIAFGILICDYVHLSSKEIELYQTSSKAVWRSPATWAFVLLRYSGILAMFPSLFLASIQNKHCHAAVMSSQVGGVLVVASSGVIFSFRVFSMWSGNRAVYAVVGFMYVSMVGCWCAVVSQYEIVTPTTFGASCHIRPTVPWAPIGYALSVAFDTVVMLLAVFKLKSHCASSSAVGYAIHRDGLVYFFITALTNIIVLVIQALGPSFDLIKPTAAPISTLITATMGARVYLNLKLLSEHTEQDLPFASTRSGDRGVGTYAKPMTPRRSASGATNPLAEFPINILSLGVVKSDTPFASYDCDTPRITTHVQWPVFTRETTVTVG
ncbi:hypothetical protein JB92DRAFT_2697292 [Gautieria morchelliformis]|nr:hypothetical protein JB92DRAFT_2697292 [Gautieria morchelliformis]